MRVLPTLLVVGLSAVAIALGGQAALAETITCSFTGTWEDGSTSESGTFTGSFTYENSSTEWGTPSFSSSNERVWEVNSSELTGWSMSFGGTSYDRADGDADYEFLDVVNNPASSGSDVFGMGVWDSSDQYFEVWLQDNTGTALDSLDIPSALCLKDFSAFTDSYLYFQDADGEWFYGKLTAASTVVPEPGTLALLGVGLAGLTLRRRRRRIS